MADDLCTSLKFGANFVVHDQVQISLPIAGLLKWGSEDALGYMTYNDYLILEPVISLGQCVQAWTQ